MGCMEKKGDAKSGMTNVSLEGPFILSLKILLLN